MSRQILKFRRPSIFARESNLDKAFLEANPSFDQGVLTLEKDKKISIKYDGHVIPFYE